MERSEKSTSESAPVINNLGEFIRERRRELGLTQTDLAATTQTSIRFVSEVERGKETARIGGVVKLLHALGYTLGVERR